MIFHAGISVGQFGPSHARLANVWDDAMLECVVKECRVSDE